MLRLQGVNFILGTIILFMILHIGLAPEHHDIRITGTTMLGGIAFLLMTISVILTTRLNIFESIFGGLDRMYQVHRVAGTSVAIFALFHFVGVPKELPVGVDSALNSLIPSAPFGMASMVLLVLGLFIALNRKISYSRWRLPHKAMALVYLLVIGHFLNAPSVFFERFSASGIMLIIAAIVGSISLFYTMLGMNKRTAKPFTIEAVNAMERATEIILKPKDGMIKFKAGQFAFLEIQEKGWSEPHPFTISSAPDENRLRFTIKVLGDWTRKIREELKLGCDVLVRGPYGRFDAANTHGKKHVWIAGGIGLTPFLSMVRDMEVGDDREIQFVYATRNRDEAIFLDELETRSEKLGNIFLHPLFSDEGEFARVETAKTKLPNPLNTYEYFICGPKPMVEGIIRDLKKEGVPRSKIHTEAFEFR